MTLITQTKHLTWANRLLLPEGSTGALVLVQVPGLDSDQTWDPATPEQAEWGQDRVTWADRDLPPAGQVPLWEIKLGPIRVPQTRNPTQVQEPVVRIQDPLVLPTVLPLAPVVQI